MSAGLEFAVSMMQVVTYTHLLSAVLSSASAASLKIAWLQCHVLCRRQMINELSLPDYACSTIADA